MPLKLIAILLVALHNAAPGAAPDHLNNALQELRQRRQTGDLSPAVIALPAGTYPGPITLTPDLVGDGLQLRSADPKAGPVVISAGVAVTNWKVTDGRWNASVDVPEVLQLFVDGESRPRARTPNSGYFRIEKTGPDRRTSFTWQVDTIPRVSDLAHTELLFLHDWSITRVAVKSLDHERRTLTTSYPIGPPARHYAIDNYEPQPRFALEGARDFLDAPGEWHFDRKTHTLSYLPKKGESPDQVRAVVPNAPHALRLLGTKDAPLRNVTLEGLTFAHAHWQPPLRGYAAGQATSHDVSPAGPPERTFVRAAVEGDYCQNIHFKNCAIRNCSSGGLWMRNSQDVTITRCRFQHLGGNGIMIGETANNTPPTSRIVIDHCEVSDCGTRYFGAIGIWIGMAQDCVVRYSNIHDLPYTGISVGWRWTPEPSNCKGHRIEHNEIHHVLLKLSDGGGIYTLGLQPGTILRSNHIHHVRVNAGRAESNGIFMDEGTTGLVVENNDIHDIARSPIRFHKAGRNILRGNKLRPSSGIPTLRFNNTPTENIIVESPE